jgi:hypothetical protein
VGPIPDKTVLKRDHRKEISLSRHCNTGYQGGGGTSEECRSSTSQNKQKHRRTLLSSAAQIDVLIKVLNIRKSLQLPKTFNEQKRHGITEVRFATPNI